VTTLLVTGDKKQDNLLKTISMKEVQNLCPRTLIRNIHKNSLLADAWHFLKQSARTKNGGGVWLDLM
jgi:hypothetical protein